MKKRIALVCICALTLTVTACSAKKSEESSDITQETAEEEAEGQEAPAASKKKESATIPFLSGGVEISDNGRYPLIFDEIYFDQISFKAESDCNVFGLRLGAQALMTYADEEKVSRTNEELLDHFIMEEAKMFFGEHLDDANVVKSYNMTTQEDVTVGDFDCTHFVGKLAGSYPDYPETWDYSFEAYCFNFNGYPMVMAGVVRQPDSYEENDKDLMDTTRSDISNNLKRMVSSVSAEK